MQKKKKQTNVPCCLNPNKTTHWLKSAELIKYICYRIIFNGQGSGSTEKISFLTGSGYGSSPCLQTTINVLVGQ